MPGRAFQDWVQLAWVGALLITVGVLAINIARAHAAARRQVDAMDCDEHAAERDDAGHRQPDRCGGMPAGPDAGSNPPRMRSATSTSSTAAHRALKGINLDLPDRQVTGLIGPSGCGKSTLLRVLNRMYDLYPGQRATGEVLMDGENIIAPGRGPQRAARRASAWCSRSRRRSRCRSTTTSPSA